MRPPLDDDGSILTDETVANTLPGRACTVIQPDDDRTAPSGDARTVVDPGGPAQRRAPASAPHPHGSDARYVVVGLAGRGGMGTVHVAKDLGLLRRVALKEMAPEAAANGDARARFIREVQVTAQLDHPYVVPVYGLEVGEGDRPAYAMKLVTGRTLGDLVAETRACAADGRPVDEMHRQSARLEVFLKVCDAVAYAHDRGVIHRDLKPANVMLGPHNEVYVMDWGLCRVLTQPETALPSDTAQPEVVGGAEATRLGAIVGTPRYMAPEQARGDVERMGPLSDLCSLGLILHELVTLRQAIGGRELGDVLNRAAEGRREPLVAAEGEGLATELAAIITKASAADPASRYASVAELAADLRRYLRGDAVLAHPDSAWQQLLRFVARHRQAAGVVVLSCATVCLAVIAGLLWRHDRALAAQQVHEQRLLALTSEVAQRGDRLQTRLLLVQAAISGLSSALTEAAEHGEAPAPLAWSGGRVPVAEGRAEFVWLNAGAPTAAADALAGRVLPVARRMGPWQDEAEAVLEGRAGKGGPSTGLPAGVTQVRAVFDEGFVLSTLGEGGIQADPRGEPWFEACRRGSGASVSTVDGGAPNDGVVFCEALTNDAGSPIGVLLVTLSPPAVLARFVAETWPERAGAVVLLDPQMRVRAGGAGRGAGAEVPWSLLSRRQGAADSGVIETRTAEGDVVLVFDRLHPFEWTLAVIVPGT